MRVSEVYGIGLRQGALDFVDVDVVNDVPLFIDPPAIAYLSSPWADSCVSSIQSFFQRVLDHIRVGNDSDAIALLSQLGEPNETHLGLSKGRSQGNAVGGTLALEFWQSLSSSHAARSGLLTDLEDTALLIESIGPDRISDVTTNLIRTELIEYTQAACWFYGIPTEEGVATGAEPGSTDVVGPNRGE
jgi:hypothetical protein